MQLEHMYVAIQVQLMKTTNRIAIVSIEIIRNYPSAIRTVHDKEHSLYGYTIKSITRQVLIINSQCY